jgi:hypothetical protein
VVVEEVAAVAEAAVVGAVTIEGANVKMSL